MLDRGHCRRDAVQAADLENLFRVGGDDQRVKARGSARSIVDPGKHRTATERSQQLARQPSGFEVRRDHAQYFSHLLLRRVRRAVLPWQGPRLGNSALSRPGNQFDGVLRSQVGQGEFAIFSTARRCTSFFPVL